MNKALKSMKFEPIIEQKINLSLVNLQALKPWICRRVSDLCGGEDDLLVEYVINQLEVKDLNPKEMQQNLSGFMNQKNARLFMKELWEELIKYIERAKTLSSNQIVANDKQKSFPRLGPTERKPTERKGIEKKQTEVFPISTENNKSVKDDSSEPLKRKYRQGSRISTTKSSSLTRYRSKRKSKYSQSSMSSSSYSSSSYSKNSYKRHRYRSRSAYSKYKRRRDSSSYSSSSKSSRRHKYHRRSRRHSHRSRRRSHSSSGSSSSDSSYKRSMKRKPTARDSGQFKQKRRRRYSSSGSSSSSYFSPYERHSNYTSGEPDGNSDIKSVRSNIKIKVNDVHNASYKCMQIRINTDRNKLFIPSTCNAVEEIQNEERDFKEQIKSESIDKAKQTHYEDSSSSVQSIQNQSADENDMIDLTDPNDSNSDVQIDNNSGDQIDNNIGEQIDIASDDQINVNSNDQIDVNSNDQIDIASDDQIDITSDDQINVNSNDQIDIASGDQIDVNSNYQIDIASGDQINVNSNDQIDIASNDQMDVNSNDQIDTNLNEQMDTNSNDQIANIPTVEDYIEPQNNECQDDQKSVFTNTESNKAGLFLPEDLKPEEENAGKRNLASASSESTSSSSSDESSDYSIEYLEQEDFLRQQEIIANGINNNISTIESSSTSSESSNDTSDDDSSNDVEWITLAEFEAATEMMGLFKNRGRNIITIRTEDSTYSSGSSYSSSTDSYSSNSNSEGSIEDVEWVESTDLMFAAQQADENDQETSDEG